MVFITSKPGSADCLVGCCGEEVKPALGDPGHIEWYSRGYLPHRDRPGLLQMITYRLEDSLPSEVLDRMSEELQYLPPEKQDEELRKKIEEWIDAGHGSCVLRNPQIAGLIIENWRHYAKTRYDLISYVVMPNHVHVLIRVYESFSLGKIVQSWKGYTGKKIREMINSGIAGNADCLVGFVRKDAKRTLGDPGIPGNADCPAGNSAKQTLGGPGGRIWHREFWDRYIRDEKHFNSAIDYIRQNPVKAGLVKNMEDWPWSGKGLD